MQHDLFCAFLVKIGRANAAKVTSLAISAEDADALADLLSLITEMVKLHMPGLQESYVDIWKKKVH